ncbi:MAG: hypothetical protein V3U18_03215 [Alphaproteobacteria bacterium]
MLGRRKLVVSGKLLLVVMGLGAAAAPARAEFRPELRTHLELELLIGGSFQADEESDEARSIFVEFESAEFDFRLVPEFGAVLNLGFEPASEEFEENGIMRRQALFAEELYIHYETLKLFPDYIDSARVFAGKFSPNFGLEFGFDQEETEFPGAVTDDFMEEYELSQKIGVGGNITPYHRKYGTHMISFSAFFDDTTFLSRDAFKARIPRKKELSDGGAGNTESLESFNLTINGSDMAFVPGLTYEVGFRHQEKGEGEDDVKDEDGFAVGVRYKKAFFLPRDRFRYPISVTGAVEYAHFSGFEARDVVANFVTAGVGADYGPWNFAVAYSRKFQSLATAEEEEEEEGAEFRRDVVDDRWQVSTARRLSPFLLLHFFWAYEEEIGQGKNILGALFEYEKNF